MHHPKLLHKIGLINFFVGKLPTLAIGWASDRVIYEYTVTVRECEADGLLSHKLNRNNCNIANLQVLMAFMGQS